MAKMIPRECSIGASWSEEKFFKTIKNFNGMHDWVVYHSQDIRKHKTKRKGEADFIFVGPHGVFVLELKGGEYHEFNELTNEYKWGDPKHPFIKKETPLEQADGNLQSIKDEFEKRFDPRALNYRKINYGYGAVFPEADMSNWNDISWDKRLIYDINTKNLATFIAKLDKFFRKDHHKNLAKSDIEYIQRHLRQKFISVPVLDPEKGKNELLIIEGQAKENLENIDFSNSIRMLCRGGAGTGKTVIARYVAEHFSLKPSNKVLWLSFNKMFTDKMRESLSKYGNIEVRTRDSLFFTYLKKYGYDFNLYDKDNDLKFAECVSECEDTFSKWDVIIIDEGQDIIKDGLLLSLDTILKGGLKNGNWFIFLDEEQDVFHQLDKKRLKELRQYSNQVMHLTKNKRNPAKIVEEIKKYTNFNIEGGRVFDGGLEITENGITGKKSEHFLEDFILNMHKKGKKDIVVLVNQSDKFISKIVDNDYLLQKSQKMNQGKIQFHNSTLAVDGLDIIGIPCLNLTRFKGLEVKNLVLYWSKDSYKNKTQIPEFYTALTRTLESAYILLDDLD